MTRPKRTKPDANQAEIVADLRKLGFDVDIVASLPGLYDIIVSGDKFVYNAYYEYGGVTKDLRDDRCYEKMIDDCNTDIYTYCSVRVEVKSETGTLNETEQKYYEGLKHPRSYIIARCTEDVLAWFGRE